MVYPRFNFTPMKIFGIFFLFLATSAFGQITTLKLGSDIWPPFTNEKPEKAFALDVVSSALERSFFKPDIVIEDFDKVLNDLKSGNLDGSAALWKTPERESYLLFSQPYLQNQLILVGRKGSDVSAASIRALKGSKVGIVSNYAYGDDLKDETEAKFITGSSDQDNLEKLLNNEIDYMLVDALLIQYVLQYQAEEAAKYLEIGSERLLTKSLHFAIRKDHPDAENIIVKFNEAILKMIADGTYNDILQLNWIKADVDGDGNVELLLKGSAAGTQVPSGSYSVWFKNEQPSNAMTSGFYIDGKYYESWNDIPSQYKTPPTNPLEVQPVNILNFKIK